MLKEGSIRKTRSVLRGVLLIKFRGSAMLVAIAPDKFEGMVLVSRMYRLSDVTIVSSSAASRFRAAWSRRRITTGTSMAATTAITVTTPMHSMSVKPPAALSAPGFDS